MKNIISIFITVLSLSAVTLHAEDKTHVYEGKITGLFCQACASKVKESLSHLEGVTKIKITSSKEQGVQNIHLESSSTAITKEAAIKALGEESKTFNLLSLQLTK